MTTYTNPRTEAVIEDWPIGQRRTTARFSVEHVAGKGERAVRVLDNPKGGKAFAPKKLTYASKMRIVDGDDGKTYIAALSAAYRMVVIWQSNMQFNHETIHHGDPRYAELIALFLQRGLNKA